jgi:four helix bundle protein
LATNRIVRQVVGDRATAHALAQVTRSTASVAANYRAAGVARSRAEFIAKLGVVIEEADEAVFWFEYLTDVLSSPPPEFARLADEARQLVRIFVAGRNTAKRNNVGRRSRE